MTDSELNYWSQLWQEVTPGKTIEPTYRLYYDHSGLPLFYSMEPCSGNYVEITAEQFAAADSHVRVVDGKLVKTPSSHVWKLVPSQDPTGVACSTYSVTIVDNHSPYIRWKVKNYESS